MLCKLVYVSTNFYVNFGILHKDKEKKKRKLDGNAEMCKNSSNVF